MTDEELDALVARLDDMSDLSRDHAAGLLDLGHKVAVHQAIAAITTLRAQLAEAHKDGSQLAAWQCLFDDGKTGIVCDDWGNQYCAMQRRADRAEAALAAQIEADARMIERIVTEARQEVGNIKLSKVDAAVVEMLSGIAKAIRAQPRAGAAEHGSYDRTALDRMLTKTREKALREAAEILDDEGWLGMSMHRIRALITKGDCVIEKEKGE